MKFRIAVVLLGAFLMVSCARASASNGSAASAEAPADPHAHHAAGMPAADAADADLSVYQLESQWRDQHDAVRTLGELRGRPQLIAMVYTHCAFACPRIVGDMKRLEAEFPGVDMVLVSIDPERDTPGRLGEFAAGSALGPRWTLLNGNDGAIMELAAVLGVRYRRLSESEFMHSNVITLLDGNGVAVHRQEELGAIESTRAALQQLLGD